MLTGRQPRELPPSVVRGLFWRAYVERAIPIIREAKAPLSESATVQQKLDHAALVKAATDLEAAIFDG